MMGHEPWHMPTDDMVHNGSLTQQGQVWRAGPYSQELLRGRDKAMYTQMHKYYVLCTLCIMGYNLSAKLVVNNFSFFKVWLFVKPLF